MTTQPTEPNHAARIEHLTHELELAQARVRDCADQGQGLRGRIDHLTHKLDLAQARVRNCVAQGQDLRRRIEILTGAIELGGDPNAAVTMARQGLDGQTDE